MQKHIRYEVEIIADESVAPSLAQLHGFFLETMRLAEKAAPSQPEDQPRRGRPRKPIPAPIAHFLQSDAASKRPQEQLFTIRRTATPVDVYFGELDEAVEKLKSQPPAPPVPPQPAPWMNPRWFEPYQPQPWQPSPAPTCNSKEPKFTISGVSYLPGEEGTIADPHTIEKLKNVKSVSISASCEEPHIDGEGVMHVPASTQPLSEIDETA